MQDLSPGENARIERGTVREVWPSRSTVSVKTYSGRVLEEVRPSSSLWGPASSGVAVLPPSGTHCAVLSVGPGLHFLLFSYPLRDPTTQAAQGRVRELLPGEWAYLMASGGHAKFSPDGTIDLKAHPWARSTLLPSEHLLKEHVRNWERTSSPLNLVRYVNSLEEEHSFHEFFLNDKFLFRDGDTYPAIIRTLGDNTKGNVSPGNPQSPWAGLFEMDVSRET